VYSVPASLGLVDLGPVAATPTDWLRLAVAPVFVWAAYRDVQVRRVPNDTWVPLTLLALVLLVADGYGAATAPGDAWTRFLLATTVSVGLIVPLGYAFWYFGAFGGADAKALFVFALLYPTYPAYLFGAVPVVPGVLPAVETPLPVFAFTILTNAVLAGVVYPVGVAAANAADGVLDRRMFVARVHPTERLLAVHGRLLGPAAGDSAGEGAGGLDLDALRMYLRWRGADLAEVRADPGRFRDPATVPEHPNDPGDGTVATARADGAGETAAAEPPADSAVDPDADDDWGAAAFLDDVEGSAYGTDPETLRDGLELVVAADAVWVSPGIPFMVPLALGVVSALTVGDVLFALFGVLGLA
jgi:preflagellin peptidase FlaK